MSSAGHIFDMINRIKANEALKKEKRYNKQKVIDAYHKKMHHIEFHDWNKLPDGELTIVKKNIRKRLIWQNRLFKWLTIIILLTVTILVGQWLYAKLF